MTFKDSKDLAQFVKSCAKLGVKELSIGDIKIAFYPGETVETGQSPVTVPPKIKVSRQASRAADAIERTAKTTEQIEEREEEHAMSLIDNPEEFEESIAEELSNGSSEPTREE